MEDEKTSKENRESLLDQASLREQGPRWQIHKSLHSQTWYAGKEMLSIVGLNHNLLKLCENTDQRNFDRKECI